MKSPKSRQKQQSRTPRPAIWRYIVTILHRINTSHGWFGGQIIGLQLACRAAARKTAFLWFNKGGGPCTDAVANWKMNENWQVSRENQSDRIGFQYGNAGEMITWKWLRRVSDFSIFWDNELVCPVGLANRHGLRRETQLKKKRQIAISIPLIFISRAVKSAENLFFLNQVFTSTWRWTHTYFWGIAVYLDFSLFFSQVLKMDWTHLEKNTSVCFYLSWWSKAELQRVSAR